MERESKSPHILNTSATLFGLCYVVFSSIKALNYARETLIDEFTSVAMVLFMTSCLFSFLAMRSKPERSKVYEKIADYLFLSGLFSLVATTVFIVLKIIV